MAPKVPFAQSRWSGNSETSSALSADEDRALGVVDEALTGRSDYRRHERAAAAVATDDYELRFRRVLEQCLHRSAALDTPGDFDIGVLLRPAGEALGQQCMLMLFVRSPVDEAPGFRNTRPARRARSTCGPQPKVRRGTRQIRRHARRRVR